MATVSVDQARPGMVLLSDVKDKKGRLLIPAGNELSDRHCQALKMWGVQSIEVELDDGQEPAEIQVDPEVEARLRAELDDRFRQVDRSHPFIEMLYEVALRRALTTAAGQGG